ncbi:MAG TPA: hypothetical protein VI958_11770 [Acidobacteriota bacterium]
MSQLRLKADADEVSVREDLERTKRAYHELQQQYQALKVQNDRLLRMEAQHQSAKESLVRKRIILSRAVILVPENMVIGDQMENCVIKIYRGNNLIITDSAKLINCRIIGLEEYSEERRHTAPKTMGSVEIKGQFYNTNGAKFAISTYEKVGICPGARVVGNIRAEAIVVSELTKVSGKFASRQLIREKQKLHRISSRLRPAKVLEFEPQIGSAQS